MSLRTRHLLLVVFVSLALWHLFEGGYIHAKAWLAQQLIHNAWLESKNNSKTQRPWPGADTHPIARLTAKDGKVDLVVLSGTSGRTLAFGPGHMDGTVPPGKFGNVVLSGHRDTHFDFLKHLNLGDQISLETRSGSTKWYEVINTEVVHQNDIQVALDAGDDRLTLITCYPFDAVVPGGPMRYAVVARALLPKSLNI
ncbi:MAG: class GN sortase [Burkholderiales bacterium]|nr:class GN sortase [Burkholderiales bacterium]OUT79694.1 MAG: sortase, marine proteobacterial type [Betaproteobacteria bacterium TMED22]